MTTITLAGKTFEVKVSEGVRLIKDRGHWLKSLTFIDRLVQENRWEELHDLANIGADALKGTLTFGSAQETADELRGVREN